MFEIQKAIKFSLYSENTSENLTLASRFFYALAFLSMWPKF